MTEQQQPKTIEERINDVILEKLSGDEFEKIAAQYADKAIKSALEDVFSSYGSGVGSVIKEKIKESMIPVIEKYDFSEYTIKLEAVLDEIMKQTTGHNKEIIKAFKGLIVAPTDKVTVSDLAKIYGKYVAETFETHGREIDYERDEPEYDPVEINVTFEEDDNRRSWSSAEYAKMIFEVVEGIDEEDELKKLNFIVPLWKINGKWMVQSTGRIDLAELRGVNPFEIQLRMMQQHYVEIEVDQYEVDDMIYSTTKPEYTLE